MSLPLPLLCKGSSLDNRISSTPTKQLRRDIINAIFGVSLNEEQFDAATGFQTYFTDWYEEQCDIVAGHASIATHREVLDVIAQLQKDDPDRSAILQKLALGRGLITQDKTVRVTVDLAARLWLSISIGCIEQSLIPGNVVKWDRDKLSDTLRRTLWPNPQLDDNIKLPRAFNAANLERMGGLKVVWTSNLADHLSLKDDDTKVMLFHQASFLELHRDSKLSVLPPGLVDETMRSLGLLIPSGDARSKTWFRQKQKALQLDCKAGTYGPLTANARQIERFTYWRDRLIILKQTFDDAEPHTLRLWWYDDRKKVQWYTFWIAALILLLTIVFGLIQSVSGVVQAWAAIRSVTEKE